MPTLYRIAKWNESYETHETRKLVRLTWIPIPNKQDGLGFRMVASEKDGAALFGAWILMVELASKSDRDDRGTLRRDGIPLDAASMAMMTGFPVRSFERALSFFSQPRIGWLVAEQWQTDLPLSPGTPGDAGRLPGQSPGRMEWNGMEGKEGNGKRGRADESAPATDSEWLENLRTDPAYQGINVLNEHAKMLVWCRTNKKQPSRRRFVNWLNRAERPFSANPSHATGKSTPDPYREPSWDWQTALREKWPLTDFPNRPRWEEGAWANVPLDRRNEILNSNHHAA